jgi:hypothetical protein
MKKTEAKEALHQLFGQWADETGQSRAPDAHPSFSSFTSWLDQKHYSHYLNFRSTAGPRYDAEMWFDRYFGQEWRN